MDPLEEIERPPLVAEGEWQDTGQLGAAYVHTYYPAFIDVPPASAFITPIDNKPIYIHVARHLKALEVTDFDNSLVEKDEGERRLPIIRQPITGVEVDSVSASGSDAWGGVGILVAQEQSLTGKIFRNTPFTEIIVGWEVRHPVEAAEHEIFYKALRRLLYAYR